jgi:short-subunit dehydrogenase
MQKNILITGCSSGIGLCAATTLQQRGYRIFATARKQDDIKKLKQLGLESLLLDVNDSVSIRQALDTILEKTNGTLDALFNNAGYAVPGAIEDLTRDMMRKQFETNVFGAMELINLVLPIMRQQGHGRIIQNCSILGIIAMPFRGAYNASKFALEGFSNTLRIELRDTPISVSLIEPGPIISEFRNNAYKTYKENINLHSSRYDNVYQDMEKEIVGESSANLPFALGPEAVVKKLIHALESARPRAHYYVGLPANLFAFLRRALPDFMLDWAIAFACKRELRWQEKQN